MARTVHVLSTIVILIAAVPGAASDLDAKVQARLKGAWAITDVEIYSNCSGTYSDNEIGPAGVSSKASRRFSPGELVKIDKVKVKRARVDLLTTIAVPVLSPYSDGPFDLFEVVECRAQLIFKVERALIKSGDVDRILEGVSAAVAIHPSQAVARASVDWNGRVREPFPPGYDLTLATYHRWKAEQTNAAVAAAIDRAGDEAADAVDDVERDPDYLDGLAAGVEEMRRMSISTCTSCIEARFSTWEDSPPSGKSSAWKRGYETGQRLVFNLYLLRELQLCFVPVPDAPAP